MSYEMKPLDAQAFTPYTVLVHLKDEVDRKLADLARERRGLADAMTPGTSRGPVGLYRVDGEERALLAVRQIIQESGLVP